MWRIHCEFPPKLASSLLPAQPTPSPCFPSACMPVFQEQKFICSVDQKKIGKENGLQRSLLFLQHPVSDCSLGVANWKVTVMTLCDTVAAFEHLPLVSDTQFPGRMRSSPGTARPRRQAWFSCFRGVMVMVTGLRAMSGRYL